MCSPVGHFNQFLESGKPEEGFFRGDLNSLERARFALCIVSDEMGTVLQKKGVEEETIANMYFRISEDYSHVPDLRLTSLLNLAEFHKKVLWTPAILEWARNPFPPLLWFGHCIICRVGDCIWWCWELYLVVLEIVFSCVLPWCAMLHSHRSYLLRLVWSQSGNIAERALCYVLIADLILSFLQVDYVLSSASCFKTVHLHIEELCHHLSTSQCPVFSIVRWMSWSPCVPFFSSWRRWCLSAYIHSFHW